MKWKMLCAALLCLLMQEGFAQVVKQYVIRGTFKGIPTGKIQLLASNLSDRTSKAVDSGIVKNGVFELKGIVSTPQMMTLNIVPGNWRFDIFVENAAITVTADTAGAKHYDYTAYGMGKMANIIKFTETGSKVYDDWMAYQNDPVQKQYQGIFGKLTEKLKATGKDINAQYKVRGEMDSVGHLQKTWQKAKIERYVDENPSSVAGVYMFYNLHLFSNQMPYTTFGEMLSKFTGEAKASIYYQNMQFELSKQKAVQPGSIAPDFTLLKRDSTAYTLSSMRGKYVMIDFWASWCHPCREAIPHWKAVYQKYHDKGFDIISVSDDSKWKDWKKAMDDEKMPWVQVCDEFPVKGMPARVGSLYMTHTIPHYVLLDKEGKILVYSADETKIDEKLKELFKIF
ncbi:AhpC/TSA family protein [Mucilaginibacter sp. ZT4R22]|uniref:AhpC/TSA family protein n=1 Tax=Mucilaginibacter pankratovii TaxID=2772110 RepID=A0ABR7WWE1_9SPHI|nr:TlpA disulfide reductase family protein [Mucilaginibacter pankratovii]MBD1366594.1 AhpC/TSA family protein [Mucilaginibacter pankratovii]